MYVVRALPRAGALMLLLVLGSVLTLAVAPAAQAHTRLVSSSPADGAVVTKPPTQVTLRFSEAVSTSFAQVKVLDAAGKDQVSGRPTVDGRVVSARVGDLPNGRYRLAYRVVSADGHPVSDELTFSVKVAPTATPTTSTPSETSDTPTTVTPTTVTPTTVTPTTVTPTTVTPTTVTPTTVTTTDVPPTTLAGEPVASGDEPSQNTWIWVGTVAIVLVLVGLVLLVRDRRRSP